MSGKSTRILCISLTVLLLSGVACRLSAPKESSLIVDADITEPSPIPTSTTTKIPPTAEPNDPMLHQWAVSAVDKYDSGMADNVTGEPDAEGCEITFAGSMWNYESELSAYHDAKAYLQLFYAEPVLPTEVNIYLAYVHSAIVKVSLLDLEGKPHQIYQDEPNYPDECPSVISIKIDHLSVPVYSVRIDLDTLDPDIYEITAIDAVELVGAPLTVHQPTPVPTPYLTISSLGFNASNVPEGFVYFEVFDNNFDISLTHTECDAFSFNISETERTIRFFSCDDSTELWLYLLPDEPIQSTPLNTYSTVPTARLFYNGKYIPAMEGEFYVDLLDETSMTGVLEFKGFDSENQIDYYRVSAVFNQIPIDQESAQKPGTMILQWAEGVDVSSEISPSDNAAYQALGTSDTWEECGIAITAWKPAGIADEEWIELYYVYPVNPVSLNILLTGPPDEITAVNLMSETDFFPLDLQEARVLPGCPTVLVFDMIDINQSIVGVQILMNYTSYLPGVDAVQMIGILTE